MGTRTDGMIPPTILIGAGSGLAPFRGFWQKLNQDSKSRKPLESMWTPMLKYFAPLCQRRESTEASSHTVELIFGCRTECSNLLENETKPLKALLQRTTAFSGCANKRKEYVQDIVRRKSRMVYDYLFTSGGLVYVCGKVSMAEAVTDTIIEAIDKHMTQEDREETSAAEYVNAMKDAGRFNQDIFGK